jgi:hypothetical protein
MFHLKRNPDYYTWTLSHTKQWNQWQCWFLTAASHCCSWWMLEFRTAAISAVLLLDEHLSQTNTSCIPKFCSTSRYTAVLFGTSLSGYALLNASRTAANDFDASDVRKWTHILLLNTPCSHLHSFRATEVSSGLATWMTLTQVSRGLDILLLEGGPASDFIFYRTTWLFWGCLLDVTLCICNYV